MQTPTFSGKRYFVTFIDDKSRYCVVYLMHNESGVFDKFVRFVEFAETQTGRRVKVLRCDNDGESTSPRRCPSFVLIVVPCSSSHRHTRHSSAESSSA